MGLRKQASSDVLPALRAEVGTSSSQRFGTGVLSGPGCRMIDGFPDALHVPAYFSRV
jgi:hypothetical protein